MNTYFSLPGLEEHYGILGKYLLGMETEEGLLELATDDKRRCEYAYFIGFKAQAEGRYEDASDWYRIATETGLIPNGEYRWARRALMKWKDSGKSLENLVEVDM